MLSLSAPSFPGFQNRFSALLAIFFCALVPHFSFGQGADSVVQTQQTWSIVDGSSLDLELSTTDSVLQFDLPAQQYLNILIIKGDQHISANVVDASGELLADSVSRRYESMSLQFISDGAAFYRLVVRSLEKVSQTRRYQLRVLTSRPATTTDRQAVLAARFNTEATKSLMEWHEGSIRDAIAKYNEALILWRGLGHFREASQTVEHMAQAQFFLSEYKEALNNYKQALRLSRAAHDRDGEIRQLVNVAYVYTYLGQSHKTLAYNARALNYYLRNQHQEADQRRGAAEALNTEGEAYYSLGELPLSISYFNRSLMIAKDISDRALQALASLNLAYSYSDSGDIGKAEEYFSAAFSLYEEISDRRGVALVLTGMGTAHSFLGEKQQALDDHSQALNLLRLVGDHEGEAVALNSIAKVYEDLNELQTALDQYKEALEIYQARGNHNFAAVTRYYIGRVYSGLGDKQRAVDYFRQSLAQSEIIGQRRVSAYALIALSAQANAEGRTTLALQQLRQALSLYRRVKDRRGQVASLNEIGHIYSSLKKYRTALRFYLQALPLSRAAADRKAEGVTLYDIAGASSELGNLEEALQRIKAAINISESLRAQIISPELRASYFSSVRKYAQLYIDLLMKMHWRDPNKGLLIQAFEASEGARARALLETLGESSSQIRQGVDPALLERERSAQQELAAKAAYRMRLATHPKASEVAAAESDIRKITSRYHEIQTQIKQQSPRFAGFVQPQPLPLEEIQNRLLDRDTLLLEYWLGDQSSYLWLVSKGSIHAYELPPRSQIEKSAIAIYELLTTRQRLNENNLTQYQDKVAANDSRYWTEATALSRVLLGPALDQLGTKRLLIVGDGALQYLPFEALPSPKEGNDSGKPIPLFIEHEIVNLPSASILSIIRQPAERLATVKRLVAIFADPVFDGDDPRIHRTGNSHITLRNSRQDQPWLEQFEILNPQSISRLSATRREADAIMSVTPPDQGIIARDFRASRTVATSNEVTGCSVVHFATHAIINTEHPELSGIVLSLFDELGENENGFLQLHDIYNLNLSCTNLVVLSACQTGLGKEIKGEGLVGLSRAFMYAGSKSVVASLWKVDDQATAELMANFYRAMFQEGLPPASALRKAKQSMWNERRWRAPYFWAAFVLEGEYESKIVVSRSKFPNIQGIVAILVTAFVVGAMSLYAWKRRKLQLY